MLGPAPDPSTLIFAALDTPDAERAAVLAKALSGAVGGVKIGKEFFTAHGPERVRATAGGQPLFLDLKFHDIPRTVAGAVRAAVHLRPRFLTLHASGGQAMMEAALEAARDAAEDLGTERPQILAITVLTSLDERDLDAIGQRGPVAEQVQRLAVLARDSGIDGAVCSPREIALLRRACGPDFVLMVPGIRPIGADVGDQKRVMAPAEAVAAGADYLVIGRPITEASDPIAAAQRIAQEIANAAALRT